MAYEVLARKWRPQQFEDVVGQDHVVQTLRNAVESDRIAHAYLFVGPRGIGKTSLARIFAKSLNCFEGPTSVPCEKCDSCREITSGTSMDVLEIDGASNNGVDQVRDLRETVKYAPSRSKFKIYIIDEVHMLSTAAFNALLKTLEEPPGHVKFIFATTEPEKILATIVSRCQRFDLRRIPVPLIVERLGLIARDEKLNIEDDALLAIARGAEGGLRDAESALDQLISFRGKEITEKDVLAVFGLVSRSALEELAGRILEGDIKGVIGQIAGLDDAGKDLQRLVLELMDYFRNLLVVINVDDPASAVDLTESQLAVLMKQAESTGTGRVLRISGILSEAENRMRYALSRRILLETSLIRCARAAVVVSLEEIMRRINELSGDESVGVKKKLTADVAPVHSPPVKESPQKPEPSVTPQGQVTPLKKVVSKKSTASDELSEIKNRWGEVVERVSKLAPLARSSLVDAFPLEVEGDRVVIGFDPEFGTEIENFKKSTRNRKAVERIINFVLRRTMQVDFVLADASPGLVENVTPERVTRNSPAEPVTEPAEGSEQAQTATATDSVAADGNAKTLREWTDDPLVAKVLDRFDGAVIAVREGGGEKTHD